MKTGVHPELYDVVYLDTSSDAQFISQSTKKSDETVKIDGKEYYVLKVEISSDSHPFYTGKQKLLDTAGRVDKFRAKMEKAKALQQEASKKVKNVDEDEEEVETATEEAPAKETPNTEATKEEQEENKEESQ